MFIYEDSAPNKPYQYKYLPAFILEQYYYKYNYQLYSLIF